jgi:bifunctional non-homologous end joining protein LigD
VYNTRNDHDWTDKFRALVAHAAELPDGIYDGELCAIDDSGAPNFSALRAAIARGETDPLVFFVFDMLFEGRKDLRPFALEARKAVLAKAVRGAER